MIICVVDSGIDEQKAFDTSMCIKSYTEIINGFDGDCSCLSVTEYHYKDIIKCALYPDAEKVLRDFHGHGTMVTEIIHTIYPHNEYHIINILDENKSGYEECFIEALKKCIAIKPDVINLSLGSFSEYYKDQLFQLTLDAVNQGILVVSSASSIPSYPAYFDHVVTIANEKFKNVNGSDFESVNCYMPNSYFPWPGEIEDTSSAAAVFTGRVSLYHGG